ncbi:MAG: rRNA adenine N-6-methyltransferase family protein [Mariprofundales bacterium]
MSQIDYTIARENMVENQIRTCKVLDPKLLSFLQQMPREAFVPQHVRSIAYMEGHVPLPCDQEMLSPLQEAYILRQLALQGDERVLVVGAGSGYLTAMLAMQAGSVVALELHPELAQMAAENLQSHGADNASVITLNAMDAEAVAGCTALTDAFDVLVVAAAVKAVPDHLLHKVTADGQVIAFVGSNPVVELAYQQRLGHGAVRALTLMETLLPDVEGVAETREFVF